MLISTKDHLIKLIDFRTFQEIGELTHDFYKSGHNSRPTWTSTGKYILAGGQNGGIFIWDTTSMGIEDIVEDVHSASISAIAWRPRANEFASVDAVGGLVFWA